MNKHVQQARIFVKNLAFSVTDIKLRQHFENYGIVNEVSILKKPNGHLLGCGFVQFDTPHGALEAVSKTNDSMFLGRKISCQLALYKERRQKQVKKDCQIKEEPEAEDSCDISADGQELVKVESNIEIKRNNRANRKRKSSVNLEDECIVKNECTSEANVPKKQKLTVYSNDINQGKTVFVKNVPFTATDDDIHDCFSEYGALEYALVVKDKYTEHSKGTAFVKFVNKEDTVKCLEAGTELQINENILDCHLALSKLDLEKTVVERLKTAEHDLPTKKDKQRSKFPRNLHLLNEGAVLAGSTAASSVSAADMQLRLSIAQQRQRRLRAEPHLVVSDRRLIVHNLPSDWTDRHLRAMCKKYDINVTRNKGKGRKSKRFGAKEVKVMRNRANDKSSKCYAYIGCDTHEIALTLLRAINNNPDAFGPPPSPHKRPIVYFSLEDRRVLLKLDKRRPENNNNNDSKENNRKNLLKDKEHRPNIIKKKQTQNDIGDLEATNVNSSDNQKTSPLKTRLKHNPRRQLQLHREQIKQRKHKQRLNKPMIEQKNRQRSSEKVINADKSVKSRRQGKGDDNFSNIVAGYRNKLTALSLTATKTKWYES